MKTSIFKLSIIKNLLSTKKRMYLFIGGILLITILIILVTGKSSVSIASYTVQKGDFVISVTESGELKAASNLKVLSPSSRGQLRIVYLIPEGTTVKEGDLLAEFDKADVLKRLSDKKVELSNAEMDLKKVMTEQAINKKKKEIDFENNKISYESSKLNAEKAKFESDLVQRQSELDMKKLANSFEIAKQEYESYKFIQQSELNQYLKKVKQAKDDIENLQKEMDGYSVKATVPGLVVYEFNWMTSRKIAIGDNPWGGMPIISLPDLSKMQIQTSVNEIDISKIKVGQKVNFKLDAFPEKVFSGSVSSVATIGKTKEGSTSVKIFEVFIDVEGSDPIFKPGMTTSNEIIVDVIPDVIYIPLESVFEKKDKIIVYKTSSGIEEIEVKLGKRNSDYVIVEQGLSPGDKVALRDPYQEVDIESEGKLEADKKDNSQKPPVGPPANVQKNQTETRRPQMQKK